MKKHVSSPVSFLFCIIIAPCVILQHDISFKIIQLCVAFLFMIMAKKQKKVASILVFSMCTIVSHILFSNAGGDTIFSILGFMIKKDALNTGLYRGIGVATLFFWSKACIRPDLHFPGRFGRIISKSMGFLYYFLNEKVIVKKNIIENLDMVLLALSNRKIAIQDKPNSQHTTIPGYIVGILLLSLHVNFLILEIMLNKK